MSDPTLLESTFMEAGRKHGLDDKLLKTVFDLLIRNQYLHAGKRNPLRGQLDRAIRKQLEG